MKIRFTEDYRTLKKGEIYDYDDATAKRLIKEKVAEEAIVKEEPLFDIKKEIGEIKDFISSLKEEIQCIDGKLNSLIDKK